MPSSIQNPPPVPPKEMLQCDVFIDRQIERTRRAVKAVDVAGRLLVAASVTLSFFLLFAVFEHWLWPSGLGVFGRALLLVGGLGAAGYYLWRELWPVVWGRINPAYAAQTIEEANPTLKNSLLNLLLFARPESVPKPVYRGLEQQAAQRLSRVPIETAVDRTHLIRIGYGFAVLVALCALYKVVSPKDPFVSASRVLFPWSDIAPASRVEIANVSPGAATITQGSRVPITAEVRGIGTDEQVRLHYSTSDRQVVDEAVRMRAGQGGIEFAADLGSPRGSDQLVGVQQDVTYWIEAGDARSSRYRLTVMVAPTLTVTRVDYDYPEYTGYADRSREAVGDIRAIEGTRVTVHALANYPIARADIDFEADGRRDVAMQSVANEASAEFTLALREDRQTPKQTSYALRFTSEDGRQNEQPVLHRIDVVPDLSPEIELLAPEASMRDVQLNEAVAIEVESRDPDFALSSVRLRGEVAGESVLDESMWEGVHSGRHVERFQLMPSRHGLRVGDVVEYWAVARDNRMPRGNETESARQRLRVISPDPNRAPDEDPLAQRDPSEDAGQQQQEEGERGEGGQQQEGEGNPADGGQQQPGQGQPGEGEQGEGEPGEGQPGESQPGDGQQGQGQPGENQQGQNQQEQGQPGPERQNQPDEGEQGEGEQGERQQGQPGEGQRGQQGEPGEGQQREGERGEGEQGQNQAGQNGQGQTEQGRNQQGQNELGQRDSGPQEAGERGPADGTGRDGGQPGESGAEEDTPVSPRGDDDGEAFDRLLKHLDKSDKSDDKSEGAEDGRGQEPEAADAEDAAGQGERDAASPGDEPGDAESNDAASDAPGGESAGDGTGAEVQPGAPEDSESESSDPRENSESPGGQETSTKGPSGAGDQAEQDSGSPGANSEMKPRDKRTQEPGGQERTGDAEPPAPAEGKQQSDSVGEQGGDRPGGGEEGGGNQAQRDGTGSAGQQQSADEGAGESSERGTGRTSPNAGDDSEASDPTGQPGEAPGEGTSQRRGEGDQPGGAPAAADRPGDEAGDSAGDPTGDATGDAARGEGPPADPADQPETRQDPNRRDPAGGSAGGGRGEQGVAGERPLSSADGEPGGDEANLDYAREKTELVLDKLSDMLEKERVNDEILDDLGWTESDLQRFVERWRQRQAAAESRDAQGQEKLEQALRRLDLKPGALRRRTVRREERMNNLSDGPRVPVPLEFRDRVKTYTRGISRSDDGE